MKLLVVCNPEAGGGKSVRVLQQFESALKQRDFTYEVLLTSRQYDVKTIKEKAVEEQPDVITIIGGDGTINDVINATYVLDCTYQILPAGSGNDFAQLLDSSGQLATSIERLMAGNTREVDVGLCNDRYFLNGLGIGFDGEVASRTVLRRWKVIPTSWKYWIEIFKQVLFYQSKTYSVRVDQHDSELRCFMISVANGKAYGGGFQVSPKSEVDDGLLDLVTIEPMLPVRRLFRIPLVEKGKHLEKDYVSHQTIQTVTVESDAEMCAHLDGEIVTATRFEVRIAGQRKFIC